MGILGAMLQRGCRYFVYNADGCLVGGFVDLKSAEDCKRGFEKEGKGKKKYFITEAGE